MEVESRRIGVRAVSAHADRPVSRPYSRRVGKRVAVGITVIACNGSRESNIFIGRGGIVAGCWSRVCHVDLEHHRRDATVMVIGVNGDRVHATQDLRGRVIDCAGNQSGCWIDP